MSHALAVSAVFWLVVILCTPPQAKEALVNDLTVISDPATGRVYFARRVFKDAAAAYWLRPEDFAPLTTAVDLEPTPDGCTVGENAAWLSPGEFISWSGVLTEVGG